MITFEVSLRRRARKARFTASILLSVAVAILTAFAVGSPIAAAILISKFTSSPASSPNEAEIIHAAYPEIFALVVVGLSLLVVCFASYLVARSALQELFMASYWSSLADAACIAGDDFTKFQSAFSLMVPRARGVFGRDVLSSNDMKSLVEIAKSLRG